MHARRSLSVAALAACLALAAPALASACPSGGAHDRAAAVASGDVFTTKTRYAPQQSARTYERAPAGFRAVYTENVSRHGSRAMSDADDGEALLALWQEARDEGALTRTGQGLGPEVQAILDANAAIGYGQLSPLGTDELAGTARRAAQRLPGLFASAAGSTSVKVDVSSSSQQRAHDSADAYVHGLEAAVPGLASAVSSVRTDDTHLYFHKSNAAYKAYLANDTRIGAAEDAATDQPKTHALARAALERSFTEAFVNRLAAGDLDAFDDEVTAAQALYALDQSAHDLPGADRYDMDRYMTTRQASWFGYLDDVTTFYENGPAFAGSDVTYAQAQPLLDDMFAALEAKRDGTSDLVATLRFTHAEEVLPLAALLGVRTSATQQDPGELFTYADNPFRGAQAAPMAANIQWDLYAKGHTYLVRMLYDEKETAFKASCRPFQRGSSFYSLDELERCYGWSADAGS